MGTSFYSLFAAMGGNSNKMALDAFFLLFAHNHVRDSIWCIEPHPKVEPHEKVWFMKYAYFYSFIFGLFSKFRFEVLFCGLSSELSQKITIPQRPAASSSNDDLLANALLLSLVPDKYDALYTKARSPPPLRLRMQAQRCT